MLTHANIQRLLDEELAKVLSDMFDVGDSFDVFTLFDVLLRSVWANKGDRMKALESWYMKIIGCTAAGFPHLVKQLREVGRDVGMIFVDEHEHAEEALRKLNKSDVLLEHLNKVPMIVLDGTLKASTVFAFKEHVFPSTPYMNIVAVPQTEGPIRIEDNGTFTGAEAKCWRDPMEMVEGCVILYVDSRKRFILTTDLATQAEKFGAMIGQIVKRAFPTNDVHVLGVPTDDDPHPDLFELIDKCDSGRIVLVFNSYSRTS